MQRIVIHGVPRSGSTWLGEILNSSPNTVYRYQPLFSYALKGFLTPSSNSDEIDEFFQILASTEDSFQDQVDARKVGKLPTFQKAAASYVIYKEVRYHGILPNLLRQAEDLKVVLLVRSPLATISSWLKAPREFRKDLAWTEMEEWRYAPKKNRNRPEEYNGYERWKEATQLFLDLATRCPEKAVLVEYRNLVNNTRQEVQRIFDFCNLPFEDQTIQFINDSTKTQVDDPYSVFREGHTDEQWRNELDPAIASEIISDVEGTDLERFLYL